MHEAGGAANLSITNADGTGKRQVTTTGDVEGPAWSPDGQWLAYAGDGGLRKVRTTAPYSPNVRYIAYYTGQWCDSPDYYLNYLDTATNVVTNLWAIGGEFPARAPVAFASRDNDRFPAFAPNNRYVLFSTSASGTPQIWRADLSGANRRKLTNGY